MAYSDQAVDLLEFQLAENTKFSVVNVLIVEGTIMLTFHTDNPNYFEHPEQYFGRKGLTRQGSPFKIYGATSVTETKKLGDYVFMEPPIPYASVYVAKSTLCGYTIDVTFYSFNSQKNK